MYQITNMVNGKIYVGAHATTNKDDDYMGSGILLNRAKKKYGLAAFKREILLECSSRKHMYSEEARIVNEEFLKRTDVYNVCLGGRGDSKSTTKDADHRRAISEALKGNTNALGSMRSEEHKQAISRAHTGRVFSEESRRKMSEAKKGNRNAAGHRLSDESKQKISAAKKGRPRKNPEMIHKVLCQPRES